MGQIRVKFVPLLPGAGAAAHGGQAAEGVRFWPVVGHAGLLFAVRIGSVGRLGRTVGVHVVSCCS